MKIFKKNKIIKKKINYLRKILKLYLSKSSRDLFSQINTDENINFQKFLENKKLLLLVLNQLLKMMV